MKEPYRKGLAIRPGLGPCGSIREGVTEALVRGTGRQGIELRNHPFGTPTPWSHAEGNIAMGAIASPWSSPAQSKTPRMLGNSMHGNREISQLLIGDRR